MTSNRLDKLTRPNDLRKSDEVLRRAALAKAAEHQGIHFDATAADNTATMAEFNVSIGRERVRVKRGKESIVIAGIEVPLGELDPRVRRELAIATARLDGASFDIDANLVDTHEARAAIESVIAAVMASTPFRDRLITSGARRVKQEDKG